jgi:asparaginyl-tRNA synthetase
MSAAGLDRRTPIRHLLATATDGASVEVTGWIKTARFSKNVSFVHVFDGSTPKTVQVILSPELAEAHRATLTIHTAVRARGVWKASPGGAQAFEVAAHEVEVIGTTDPEVYPIQKKATSLEHLRTIAHLRPRTNTFQSVFRVRNQAAWQIHKFFQDRGFMWIHTPILTTSDAEGAGELFEVRAGEDPAGFFGRPAFLTVSGQLSVENFSQAFTDVYTFGPTFRAEPSNTARHASEFWMIEPEMAFADLQDDLAIAEAFVREVTEGTLAACADDMDFFDQRIEEGLLDALRAALARPFARMTWHEARALLIASGREFAFDPRADDFQLQTEHERFLAEEHVQGPVFVTNYPAEQKAFYMRLDDAPAPDGRRTVSAMDLLMPRIGEMIGGSQREERLDVLDARIRHHGLDPETYWWYRDLRRFGTTPHAGFGLGFERLLLWLTGMKNIRDVIPFPRTPGSAEF